MNDSGIGASLNTVWIVGNGFDVNLGLKTGYSDFYHSWYSCSDKPEIIQDHELLTNFDLNKSYWSDLEILLGEASSKFDEFDEFNGVFQRMQNEIACYITEQESRFQGNRQPVEFFTELLISFSSFASRLDASEKNQVLEGDTSCERDEVSLVSLNYTDCVERALEGAQQIIKERGDDNNYPPVLNKIVHPHGLLSYRKQIAFGVQHVRQLGNERFHHNEDCLMAWTKAGRDELYGNGNLNNAYELLMNADVIACFGCSYGPTDGHIWEAVGQRLKNNKRSCFISFEHSFPGKDDAVNYMKRRRQRKSELAKLFNLTQATDDLNRIIVSSSSLVFDFSGEAAVELLSDPVERRAALAALAATPLPVGTTRGLH